MRRWTPSHIYARRHRLEFVLTQATLAMLALAAAVPIALAASFIPRMLLLPVLCLVAAASAAATAAFAWWRGAKRHNDRVTAWDTAGALALIACGAAIFSQPNSVLELFELTSMAR